MRLFVGIMTPAAIDDALDAVLDPAYVARAREAGLDRWTPREERHITLRFVGATDADAAIERATAAAAAMSDAPALVIGPHAVQLTSRVVAFPVAGAADLAAVLDAALVPAGIPTRDRPFTGHLTIARSRRRLRPGQLGEALSHPALAIPWAPPALEVVQSVPGEGPRYRVLAAFPFTG
ncbi:2'-5' RNA ligase family protein [Demequina soli]|uniref:2'-5' RNA ligase family protein n=1 Tax=Demequina soli TaxID=1638987 RepID=UPI0007813AE4|nr:2'-5' RNA ligase family protein [Demequina soli]